MTLCVIAAFGAAGPAMAVASGPSAGDQQYVDPLGGSNGSHHSSTTTTTATPPPAPAPAPSSSTPATATLAASTTTTPTATASTPSSSKTLPFTGINAWLAALVGVALLGLGAGMRRAVRRGA